MLTEALRLLGEAYPLAEQETGAFHRVRRFPVVYFLRRFRAEGLGSVALLEGRVMRATRLETMLITPHSVDMPLLILEYARVRKTVRVFAEPYQTLVEDNPTQLERFQALDKQCARAAGAFDNCLLRDEWAADLRYTGGFAKQITKAAPQEEAQLKDLALSYCREYLRIAAAAAPCDTVSKHQATQRYAQPFLAQDSRISAGLRALLAPGEFHRLCTDILFA